MYASLHLLKSFGVTIRRFVDSYVDDLKWFFKGGFGNRYSPEALPERQSVRGRGVFAVQYPNERLPLPERYRGFPFLVEDRCTACGTCAKACPPQCIWIKRATDPETGKSLRRPEAFYIDISVCMNCGFCSEFCPFDAIHPGQDIEMASFTGDDFLWDLDKLTKPVSHHAEIHPTAHAVEQEKLAKKKKKK
jgi:NADH-quinone oxidoreductase subunit I